MAFLKPKIIIESSCLQLFVKSSFCMIVFKKLQSLWYSTRLIRMNMFCTLNLFFWVFTKTALLQCSGKFADHAYP